MGLLRVVSCILLIHEYYISHDLLDASKGRPCLRSASLVQPVYKVVVGGNAFAQFCINTACPNSNRTDFAKVAFRYKMIGCEHIQFDFVLMCRYNQERKTSLSSMIQIST